MILPIRCLDLDQGKIGPPVRSCRQEGRFVLTVVRGFIVVILLLAGLMGSSAIGVTAGQAMAGEGSARIHCSGAPSICAHTDGCEAAICATSAHCASCAALLPLTDAPTRMLSHMPQIPPARFRLADGRPVAPANEPPRRI